MMVTANEYVKALETPVPISLCEARYASSFAQLAVEVPGPGRAPKEATADRKAAKIGELAFWRWLRERRVSPPRTRPCSIYYLCEADSIVVCGRRVEIRAEVRPWNAALASPIRHFGLRLPVGRLHGAAGAADYYVYCLVDPDFSKAALVGYYEGYAMLSHEARTGVVQHCVAVPVSWLHPMDDLLMILHAGCACDGADPGGDARGTEEAIR